MPFDSNTPLWNVAIKREIVDLAVFVILIEILHIPLSY